jgi:hypothetical protein
MLFTAESKYVGFKLIVLVIIAGASILWNVTFTPGSFNLKQVKSGVDQVAAMHTVR